jgi:ATP adenylyltransferase
MKQLWAPWRMAYIDGAASPDGCFLCRAVADDAPPDAHVVERAELTVTLLNRFPYSSGHVMVVPRRHAPDILALTPDEGSAVFSGLQRAVRALDAALNPGGYNVGINQGAVAGASIEHVHLHVVPRWAGDTNFMPVLADTKVLPEHLDATAEKLRAAYSSLRDA